MTAVTILLGVLPGALGCSADGEVRAGMGRVVPVAYTVLDDLQEKMRNLLKSEKGR